MPPPTVTPSRAPGTDRYASPRAGRPGDPAPPADPARDVRRAITLVLLSLLAPGSAQMVAGQARGRRLGGLLVRCWLGMLGSLLLLGVGWLLDAGLVLSLLTSPLLLAALAGLLLLLGVGWPALIVDAWRLGNRQPLPMKARRRLAGLTAVLVLLTFLIPVGAGQRVWAARDLITSVFGGGRRSAAVNGRYTVLLMGGDAGKDRIGLRPDSINVASIDEATGRTVVFSLPRNLQNVHFPAGTAAARALPQGWTCGDVCLLNAVYTWGRAHATLFPGADDPGAEAMKEAVQGVTGLKVNYYVLIDLMGFRSLIDAMGGITITATTRVPIGGETSPISGYIKPGRQHLNGYHALWYARSRTDSSDYARMARQRCVMTAMVNQLDPATALRHFQAIAAAGKQVVATDIPASQLSSFLELATKAKRQRITSVQFVPPLITPAHPDFALIRSRVTAAIQESEHPAKHRTAAPAATAPGGQVPAPSSASGPAPAPTATASAGPVDVRSVCTAG